jgi:hypothetical protein
MGNVIRMTFGGLTRQYYLRQLFFGCIIAAVMYWMKTIASPASPSLLVWMAINTLLYPYARFVWESIVGFIFGANVFIVPAIILLFAKLVTMFLCWQLAILIAPIGLGYLYWHHRRGNAESA